MEPLVGIVVVSHSAQIAAGTVELARQMAGDDLRIEAAGGTRRRVARARTPRRSWPPSRPPRRGAGVVVLMDLGSAVLATQTALELLGERRRGPRPALRRAARGGRRRGRRPGERRRRPRRGARGGGGGRQPAQDPRVSGTAAAGVPGAPRRVAVLGAGAVGTLLGGLLASSGADVVLAGPAGGARRRRRDRDPRARRPPRRAPASAGPPARPRSTAAPDLAVLAVKTFDLAAALDDLRAWPATPVLTIQNGVGRGGPGGRRPSRRRARRGLADGARSSGRAPTRCAGAAAAASAWRRWPAPSTAWWTSSSAAFAAAGLPARRLADARAMKWSKLVANLVGNALSALADRDPAEVYADPALFDLERRQLLEALAVMRAQGIGVVALPGANVPLLALGVRLPGAALAAHPRPRGRRGPRREVAVAAAPPARRGAGAVGGRLAQRRRRAGGRRARRSDAGQRRPRRPRRRRDRRPGAGGGPRRRAGPDRRTSSPARPRRPPR